MGFRFPAQVEFDYMYLDDPTAVANLMLAMADRNIVSDEFVQRHVKARPEVEFRRVADEEKRRVNRDLEKISPYHAVDKEYGLQKIALQTGVVSPTQVGVKLQKKNGDRAALDMRKPPRPRAERPPNGEKISRVPGRPKNTRDNTPRKTKQFKPKTKASVELWAKEAQSKISKFMNPGLLSHFGKKNMRSLTSDEFSQSETIKFGILYNLDAFASVDEESIALALGEKLTDGVITKCNEWISNAAIDIDRKLSIEEIRNIRISFYVDKYSDDTSTAEGDL